MPPKMRSLAEIEEIRQSILDQALDLIVEEGFEGFSMRKLAKRLGVTAVTIYSYYLNKDDLYLAIITRGFAQLYERCLSAYDLIQDPLGRLRAMLQAYVDFGVGETNVYNLMFTWSVPKYEDYVGTELEKTANQELTTALKVSTLFMQAAAHVVNACEAEAGSDETPTIAVDTLRAYVIALWCTLHGYISGCNNTLLNYIHPAPRTLEQPMINLLIHNIQQMKYEVQTSGASALQYLSPDNPPAKPPL
ncbi:MAG: TetR/AcrR family transcriptional regulator [Anaerolineae bacterium]